jgi:hypothetical protein
MLNTQIILGLYRESTLKLMVSSPPLNESLAKHPLTEAYKKYCSFQSRDYLNSSNFLVKCFYHEQHNFIIICLISGYIYSKANKIFNRVIDLCFKSEGIPTVSLNMKLQRILKDQRIEKWLASYDFKKATHVKKVKEGENKDEIGFGLELGDDDIDGSENVFGFLQKQEAPDKSGKVRKKVIY